MLKNFLLVGLGGCLGSMMRYAVSLFLRSTGFPAATLLVNISGCFVIGIVMGLGLKQADVPQARQLFFATGICGGFTTFSAFGAENLQVLQNGKYLLALLYTSASIIFGIAAAWLGLKLVTN